MAGIGFELRKLLKKRTYTGLIQAYAFAGLAMHSMLVHGPIQRFDTHVFATAQT